jgi:hypothetical protein
MAAVRDALGALPPLSGRVVRATRSELEGTLAALEARTSDAKGGFTEAIRRWRELGARYQLALAQLNFVWMLGSGSAEARRAAHEAREIFTALHAEPFIRFLDEALSARRTTGLRAADAAAPRAHTERTPTAS